MLDDDGDIEIFTPAELRKILAVSTADTLPYLVVLGAFAGIRTAEILRLNFEDIDLAGGLIELKAKRTKTRARRLIPISDNLRLWLQDIGGTTGPGGDASSVPMNPSAKSASVRNRRCHGSETGLGTAMRATAMQLLKTKILSRLSWGTRPPWSSRITAPSPSREQAKQWFAIVPEET